VQPLPGPSRGQGHSARLASRAVRSAAHLDGKVQLGVRLVRELSRGSGGSVVQVVGLGSVGGEGASPILSSFFLSNFVQLPKTWVTLDKIGHYFSKFHIKF
jgi:hypothetical protein